MWIIMIGLNFMLGAMAWLLQRLTGRGAIAAGVIGSLIWLGGGIYAWSLLGIFFVSSSFWSGYKEERKYQMHQIHEKGSQRDVMQVLANGGVAALCCVGYQVTQCPAFLVAVAVSLAAATADTWASEIGVLSSKPPRSILTMKPMPTGLSGGVSWLGTISQIVGALMIAIYASTVLIIFNHLSLNWIILVCFISAGGILGSLVDSLLGSLLQAKYECPVCQIKTEKRIHHGVKTSLVSGVTWLTNDHVNLISNIVVTGLAIMTYSYLTG